MCIRDRLWTWETVNSDGWAAQIESLLEPGEALTGATGAGRTLKGREITGGTSIAPNTTQEVTVPYWDNTGEATPYLLAERNADGGFTRVNIALTEDGIQFTGKAGASYYLTTLSKATYNVTLYPNGGAIAAGQDVTSYTYGSVSYTHLDVYKRQRVRR